MQSLVNLVYGIVAGLGLYLLGVPYPLVWAALGAALRFIPYVGPVIGAGAPILVSLAALRGLGRSALGHRAVRRPRAVHEPRARDGALCRRGRRLAGGAAGVGGVLDVAVGPARPAHGDAADRLPRRARQARARARVRRDADGRHAGARRRTTATTSGSSPATRARRPTSIERHIKTEPPHSVYDALLLPALNYAERDRLEQRLSLGRGSGASSTRRASCCRMPRTAIRDLRRSLPSRRRRDAAPPLPRTAATPLRVLGYAVNGAADELALGDARAARRRICRSSSRLSTARLQASELVALVKAQGVSVVCLADLPPSPPSKTRYLVKRLHAAAPSCGSWSDAGRRRRSPTRARSCCGGRRHAGGVDAGGDADVPRRAGRDPADSAPLDRRRATGGVSRQACRRRPHPVFAAFRCRRRRRRTNWKMKHQASQR